MSENEQADDSQKTEEPTPKRLDEARKKGQVAMSREVNNWVMLFIATIIIGAMGGHIMSGLNQVMIAYLERAYMFPSAPGGMKILLGDGFVEVLKVLAMPLILLMLAAFLSPLVQIGPLFAPESIKPSLSKISPIKGFGRLFSQKSLVEFAKGILKIGMIGLVGVIIIYPYYGQFEHLVGLPIPLFLEELLGLLIQLMIGVLIVLLIIAVIDISFQRMDHHKKMRMTKQELKDEYKQTEGDPHIRAKLRQLRTEKSRQRMMQAVPEADVVITNPTHFSVALKYDPEKMEAPVCVAKGIDEVALRIRELAKAHDITLFENPPLARSLYKLVEIDEAIPPDQYKAVAEVISYVFRLKNKLN